MKKVTLILFTLIALMGCSENYSNGERIGLVTQFSETGLFYKSWEGHLNMTQTGMNSSTPFDFSVDNDRKDIYPHVIPVLDSAALNGWKVRLHYHETRGWNWLSNRGETNHFIDSVQVLDKNPIASALGGNNRPSTDCRESKPDTVYTGIRDTIYLVLQKNPKE
jgi:hypothetical protein